MWKSYLFIYEKHFLERMRQTYLRLYCAHILMFINLQYEINSRYNFYDSPPRFILFQKYKGKLCKINS